MTAHISVPRGIILSATIMFSALTQVQTIGESAGITVAPTYAPRVTQDYDVRIAALEAQNAELISEQQAQRSLLDQLLALLGLS